MSKYREHRVGSFRYAQSDTLFFRRYGVGPALALTLRDAPWWVKLRRLRGIRVTIAGTTHWVGFF